LATRLQTPGDLLPQFPPVGFALSRVPPSPFPVRRDPAGSRGGNRAPVPGRLRVRRGVRSGGP
jgi:hypothetical protein